MNIVSRAMIALLVVAYSTQAKVVEITSPSEFDQLVLQSDENAVVKFYMEQCGPCKRLKPLFDELEDELCSDVTFYSVKFDTNRTLFERYSIRSVPTILFFSHKKLVSKASFTTKHDLKEKIVKTFSLKS